MPRPRRAARRARAPPRRARARPPPRRSRSATRPSRRSLRASRRARASSAAGVRQWAMPRSGSSSGATNAGRSPDTIRPSIVLECTLRCTTTLVPDCASARQAAWLPCEAPLIRNQLRAAPQASAASSWACWKGVGSGPASMPSVSAGMSRLRARSPNASSEHRGRPRRRPCGRGRGSAPARARRTPAARRGRAWQTASRLCAIQSSVGRCFPARVSIPRDDSPNQRRFGDRPAAVVAVIASLVLVAAMLVADRLRRRRQQRQRRPAATSSTITEGKLRVGSDIPYTPFEFGRAPDYEGFDVDIVNEIAKRLDLEAEFVKTPFDPIFRNLAQGKFDMVASAATITPEREKDGRLLGFRTSRRPVADGEEGKRHQDGRRPRRRRSIGAQLGTTGADYAKEKTKARDGAHLRPHRRRIQGARGRPGRGRDQRLARSRSTPSERSKNLVVVQAITDQRGVRASRSRRSATRCGRPSTRRSPR